ncbi:MAG: GatB/YqeY domain-containing protein, partial [Chitinophagaceae bacterium]|nr:GatB/YqeY domain-containing protein [Chitinophagaceae bacterium]
AQLGNDELKQIISGIIKEAGASSPSDMGKIMSLANKQLAGKAEGKTIAAIVKELLSQPLPPTS